MQRRGLSDIVTTVLVILIALAAVVIIWNFLRPFLSSSGINTDQFTTNIDVPESSISIDPNTGLAYLKVDRRAGEGDVEGFIIGFEDPAGNIKTFRQNMTINELELRNIVVNYSDLALDDIISISVTPIFKNNKTGEETLGQPIKQPVKNKTSFKLPIGLIAHWKLDGTWVDSINGVNGGSVGSAGFDYSNRMIGDSSATFPGASTSYMSVPDNVILNRNEFTVVAWVYPKTLNTSAISTIADKSNFNTGFRMRYDLTSNMWQFLTFGSGTSNMLNISESISLNNWNFIAASINGANQKSLYYNTQSVATVAPPYTISGAGTVFRAGQFINGNIDEIMFFNRSLSASEIQSIRTKYKG